MSPNGGGLPTGRLLELIESSFGTFDGFKDQFSQIAAGHFGSGWAWLVQDPESKKLEIVGMHDAGNPLRGKL